jgi:hypothetical protein
MSTHTSHQPYGGIHFLHCGHGKKCIKTHDVICKTFIVIVQNVGFHVWWKQLHALPSTTFDSSYQWVNIVFIKNGIRTLSNVVISDPHYYKMWV